MGRISVTAAIAARSWFCAAGTVQVAAGRGVVVELPIKAVRQVPTAPALTRILLAAENRVHDAASLCCDLRSRLFRSALTRLRMCGHVTRS